MIHTLELSLLLALTALAACDPRGEPAISPAPVLELKAAEPPPIPYIAPTCDVACSSASECSDIGATTCTNGCCTS